MNEQTIQELKAAMGYETKPAPRCDKCKFVNEGTDQSGGWYYECTLNPAFTLTVQPDARCKFYQPSK